MMKGLTDPLAANLERGRACLGMSLDNVEGVEFAAQLGFDWFMIDHMFSDHDWGKTMELIRAGQAYGISPVVRVQSLPWTGQHDSRIKVDFSRAQGIGARYVVVSCSDVEEIRECVEVSFEWHRRSVINEKWQDFGVGPLEVTPGREFSHREIGSSFIESGELEGTTVIPLLERAETLSAWEEMLSIPEIRIIWFAMTDGSMDLKKSPQPDFYYEPLWELLDAAVAGAKKEGKTIAANVSYGADIDELEKRAVMLYERGVRMIHLQGRFFLFKRAIEPFLHTIREAMDLN